MGAWGSGLYANDTTCDVRDAYMKLLQEQLSNEDAYAQILAKFADYIDDPDDAPLFWFALADTQWKAGRLLPEVKSKALDWIDKGGGLSLWEESESGGAGWRKTLDKLRAKLETEQPKEKRVRNPVKIESNLWSDGDVYAYQFHKEFDGRFGAPGKYMVLHKIGVEHQYYGDSSTTVTYMIVRVFDKLFDEFPTLLDLQGVRLLPFSHPYREQELQMQMGLTLYKKKDYPAEYLTFLGNIPVPEYTPLPHGAIRVGMLNSSSSTWFNINHWSYYFNQWQGISYEIDASGEFKHTQRRIISCKLAHTLYPLSYIHAFWLEGADATGIVDEYSDLDFWVDFEDEYEEQAIAAVENALSEIAEIDYKHIIRHEHPKIRQRIYHLAGTSEYLMIDFCWQLHSRQRDKYSYQENDPIETARIIFDKAGAVIMGYI